MIRMAAKSAALNIGKLLFGAISGGSGGGFFESFLGAVSTPSGGGFSGSAFGGGGGSSLDFGSGR